MVPLNERGPVAAQSWEREAIVQLDAALHDANPHRAKLIAVDGTAIELPESVALLLHQVAHCLAQGRMVTVVPTDQELTTQQAADILNVSRPHVVMMLDDGEIPYRKTGSHRRIRFDDLMAYKARRDAARHAALDELTELGEALEALGVE
jgi:excisionase family DNA binding protein